MNNIEGNITECLKLRQSFSYSSKFACKFLSFAYFLKTFFHFRSCPLIPRYILETWRQCYRKTNPRLNKLLLRNMRTNRERVILPSVIKAWRRRIITDSILINHYLLPFKSSDVSLYARVCTDYCVVMSSNEIQLACITVWLCTTIWISCVFLYTGLGMHQ